MELITWSQMENLPLPAFHCRPDARLILRTIQLKYMSDWCLPPISEPQYFWLPDGNWYQAVNIRKIRRAPLRLRFFGPGGLLEVEFELQKLERPAFEWKFLYRDFLLMLPYSMKSPQFKAARHELRICKTQPDVVTWYSRNIQERWVLKDWRS